MPEYISLMPEPGTPAYTNMLNWMRKAWEDPRNVAFRAEVRKDEGNMAFLTQGGSMPLPDVEDPVRKACEVNVTLLLSGAVQDADKLLDDVERVLRHNVDEIGTRDVIDVLLPDDPKDVVVLDPDHYRPGDHFHNPLPQEAAS